MAKQYTYEWASGKWADRANLNYIPVDKCPAGSILPDNLAGAIIPAGRYPYKVEDTETGVIYMTYSSKETAAIIKITEG